jgi:hypothetical protein
MSPSANCVSRRSSLNILGCYFYSGTRLTRLYNEKDPDPFVIVPFVLLFAIVSHVEERA